MDTDAHKLLYDTTSMSYHYGSTSNPFQEEQKEEEAEIDRHERGDTEMLEVRQSSS